MQFLKYRTRAFRNGEAAFTYLTYNSVNYRWRYCIRPALEQYDDSHWQVLPSNYLPVVSPRFPKP